MASTMESSKKRKYLTVSEKVDIINRLDDGLGVQDLAKDYGVNVSTISRIRRRKYDYKEAAMTVGGLTKKSLREPSNVALEEALYTWFCQKRAMGESVTGPLLCEKALVLNEKLNGSPTFKASNGWLDKFKQRHNIRHLSAQDVGTIENDIQENVNLPILPDPSRPSTSISYSPNTAKQGMESETHISCWTSDDYRAKWKNIVMDGTEYIIMATKEKDAWKVSFSNLVELWMETLTKDAAVERCQKLNPHLDIDSFDVMHTIEEIFNDIPKYAVGMSVNQMKLNKVIEGVAFKLTLDFTKGSPQQFWEQVTKPLCQSSRELQRRHDYLLDLVKKKDEEITEYKMSGAELTRKNIETMTFHEDLLRTEISMHSVPNCINTFQAMLDLYNEMKIYETSVKVEKETPIPMFRKMNNAEPAVRIKIEREETIQQVSNDNESNERYAVRTKVVNDVSSNLQQRHEVKEIDYGPSVISDINAACSNQEPCRTGSKNAVDPLISSEVPLK